MKTTARHFVPVLALLLAVPLSAQAAFQDGVAAYNRGDHAAAADIWREDASAGDPAAQRNLGLLYLNGQGVPQDVAAAVQWFRRSAEQGFPRAAANLGDLHLRGIGVPRDPEKAVEYFRQAAEGGLPEAQHNLGVLIESGFGVDRNLDLARAWYQRAAAGGHAAARERLAGLAPRRDDAANDAAVAPPLTEASTDEPDNAGVAPSPAGDGGLIDSLHALLTPSG